MTAGHFEPYGVARPHGQGGSDQRGEGWEQSESWDHAESWNYDEARANPDAYDMLELRIMRDREQRPQFTRFQAAMAETVAVTAALDAASGVQPAAAAGWRATIRTGRLWASALWLLGAAGAGMVTGLVSTNLVALALNPGEQVATPSAAARSALSAPAPSAVTTFAQASARQAPRSEPAELSIPAGGLMSSAPAVPASRSEVGTSGGQATARAETLPAPVLSVSAAPTRRAEAAPKVSPGVDLAALWPAPNALELAALIEPLPGLPEAMRAVEVPAAKAERERAPIPSVTAVAAPPKAPAAPAAVPAAGQYRVQLALLRDQQNAKYIWRDFVAKLGSSAKDLQRYVVPTTTARGPRHLLQVGPFGDAGRAEAMCERLKQQGGDCLVVREPS